jgi:hypothetical protein
MAEEPTPPPAEEQSEDQGEEDVYPFIDAAAGGGPGVTVRAGWADQETGDPVEFVVNYNGSAGSPTALATFEAALEWYRDTVSALVRAKREEE